MAQSESQRGFNTTMEKLIQNSRVAIHTPFFYGWAIVVISALGLFFSGPGQTYSVSTFINSYILEFGWSRSFVSSLYSTGTLFAGFTFYIIGKLIDTKGHRFMFPLIALLFGVACIWMSLVFSPVMLLIGFFLIRLLGQGSMTLVSSTLVPQWFILKRGRALSLMSLGGVLGSAILPPFNTWIIATWGWRAGWQIWGVLLLLFMAPLARLLVRNKPEDVGLLPDNRRGSAQTIQETPNEAYSWTLAEAKRTRAFWLLLFTMFVSSMVNTGLVFHMVSILGEQGLVPSVAALVLSLIAVVALPSTFIAGYLLDRVKSPTLIIAAVFGGQVLLMIWLAYTRSVQAAIVFGVARGIVAGFEGISFNAIWPAYYGRSHLGSIRGFSMSIMVIASAFGPLPFGIAYDLFTGYTEIIWVMLTFPVLAVVAGIYATKPDYVSQSILEHK